MQQQCQPNSTSQPRHSLKREILKNIRQNFVKTEEQAQLNEIIEQSTQYQQINETQLKKLIEYVRKSNNNAIIHLGTDVFDIFGVNWIKDIKVQCQYYQWLIVVLLGRGCLDFSFQLYTRALVAINNVKSQFKLLNCIKCICFLIKSVPEFNSNYLLPNFPKKSITYLLSKTLSPNSQLSRQSWQFAHTLLNSPTASQIHSIIQILTPSKILSLCKQGLLSIHSRIRSLACQILSNNIQILMQTSDFHQLFQHVWEWVRLLQCEKEKDCVKVQISFLVVGFLEGLRLEDVFVAVLKGLGKYGEIMRELGDRREDVKENYRRLCHILSDICYKTETYSELEHDYKTRILAQINHRGLIVQDTQL